MELLVSRDNSYIKHVQRCAECLFLKVPGGRDIFTQLGPEKDSQDCSPRPLGCIVRIAKCLRSNMLLVLINSFMKYAQLRATQVQK